MAVGRPFRVTSTFKVVTPLILSLILFVKLYSLIPSYRQPITRKQYSDPGDIDPHYIRTLSDVQNSELLRFILTNGTGDVSEGGRIPINLLEPFIERIQTVEKRWKNTDEKSLTFIGQSTNVEEGKGKDSIKSNDNNDDSKFTNSIERTKSDERLQSLLINRMLQNAIVQPPPGYGQQSSLLSSSSSASSLSSSSSSSSASSSSSSSSSSSLKKTPDADNIQNRIPPTTKQLTSVNENNDYNMKAEEKKDITETEVSPPETSVEGKATVPFCNETRHSTLVGRLAMQMNVRTLMHLQTSNLLTDVEVGGHVRPKDCKARERTAIIIPYRDREEHLSILLFNLFPVLIRQGVDATVFVIEENMPTPFNRAMLFNIGFLEASKLAPFDCFIFHDVDLIPIDDRNRYECHPEVPLHFLAGVDKFNYKLMYAQMFGGVVGLTKSQYKKINGASNLYFGWGGEDDDMSFRVRNRFPRFERKPVQIGLYNMIKHYHVEATNKKNPWRISLLRKALYRQDIEGLNTTSYQVTSTTKAPFFTKINVDINFQEVLKTAPEHLLKEVNGMEEAFSKLTKTS